MNLSQVQSHFNAILPELTSFGRGLQLGCSLNEAIQREQSFRQGRHHFHVGLIQFSIVNTTFEAISNLVNRLNSSIPLLPIKCVCLSLPPIISIVASQNITNLKLRKVVNFIQSAVGPLCLIVAAVSSVALFILGDRVYSVTSLATLGIGLLAQIPQIPYVVRKTIERVSYVVGHLTAIAFGEILAKIIATVDLVVELTGPIFTKIRELWERRKKTAEVPVADSSASENSHLTNEQIQEVINGTAQIEINKNHVRNLPAPPPLNKEFDNTILVNLANTFNWSDHQETILKKLNDDDRWKELNDGKDPIAYLKENIQSLSDKVSSKKILDGEPLNYDLLQRYYQSVCQALIKENLDLTIKTDIMIQLGIEGGDYCGAGIFRSVEQCYSTLMTQSKELDVKTRILICLQEQRERIFQAYYQIFWKTNIALQIIGYLSGTSTIHTYNRFVNLTGGTTNFGIVSQSAKQDPEAYITPTAYGINAIVRRFFNTYFWSEANTLLLYLEKRKNITEPRWKLWKHYKFTVEMSDVKGYCVTSVMDELKTLIRTPAIPQTEIYKWWQNWIQNNPNFSEEEKKAQQETLIDLQPTLFGEKFSIGESINPKFIKLMLIEMGIFKISTQAAKKA